MPCRCCGAPKRCKGFEDSLDTKINNLLKNATDLIVSVNSHGQFDNIDDWKKSWQEAFEHHLNGCPEKGDEK